MSKLLLVVLLVVYVKGCYWNSPDPYRLFGSKTPYDTVRGDIRDYAMLPNCKAVSIWTLNRHGNRNPSKSSSTGMKEVAVLKDEIIESFDAGSSQLCAQDIEDLRKWTWNDTLKENNSYLTATGYDELYGIGKRIREKYSRLLYGPANKFYFRPTLVQRTIASCAAFIHGFTEGTNLNITVEEARQMDNVIRPYEDCDRYQKDVKRGKKISDIEDTYFASPKFIAIQKGVQTRLGIATKLNASMIFSIYELCRFYRSWAPDHRSPWCAAFTNEDLVYLEYHDDVKHYHKNGYGSWVNEKLGRIPLKDLYDNFMAYTQGGGRKVSAHFTHDTLMEMAICALGLDKDSEPLQALVMNPKRVWRTSYIGSFATNIIAVLNSCNELESDPSAQHYRVQIFVNEKETPICPLQGCTWEEFQDKFKNFADANLDFCSKNYEPVNIEPSKDSDILKQALWPWH